VPGSFTVAAGIREQVHGVRRLAEPARDDTSHHQSEAPTPVVVDLVELVVRPPRLPVGAGQVTQLGGGVRLNGPQRADRPAFPDPLTEREERVRQPSGFV
jgi:hypothetical protein